MSRRAAGPRDRAALARLGALARVARDSETQKLAALAARMQALEDEARGLRAALAARRRDLALDPARMSGADLPWARHVERELRRIEAARALLAAEREGALAAARRAFGRSQAIEALEARAEKDRRMRQRRAEE